MKTPEARFSNALERMMNELAAEGWEYQRAETLPSIERSGLTGSTTEWRNVLVFRKVCEEEMAPSKPELLPPPAPVAKEAETIAVAVPEKAADPETKKPEIAVAQKPDEMPKPEQLSKSLTELRAVRNSEKTSS